MSHYRYLSKISRSLKGTIMTTKKLFTNVRLIDGLADQAVNGVSMLIEGERISQIAQGSIDVLEDVEVIDLSGKTILPGLIDTHIHTVMIDSECFPLFLAAGFAEGGRSSFYLMLGQPR